MTLTSAQSRTTWHRRLWISVAAALFTILLCVSTIPAQAAGLLKPLGGGDAASLSISSHRVDVVINNGYARTEVDQTFANSADRDLEALYTFPLPKQASLSELSLWVNGQEWLGEVVEKERAKKIYQEQQAQGNDTALAEKDDFKSFDVRIGRVPAGGEARVRLVYYQPLEIDLNVGRYLYPLAEGNVDEERIAFWSEDDRVDGPFSFHLTLKSAFPVKDVRLAGYQNEALIQQTSGMGADGSAGDIYEVTLNKEAGGDLSRDLAFYYRLDDSAPARVELIPYRDDPQQDGTFMLVVTPAADLQRISEGSDWIFVLDVSGSMGGHKIATLADGVARVLGKMSPNDRFRIVTFNDRALELTPGYVQATPDQVQQWIAAVKSLQANGGTNLFAGLERAYHGLDDDRTSGVILVTDGVANIGHTEHREFLKLLKTYDLRLFTFVIGNGANQPLLDRLARDSGGFAMNLSDSDDITGRLIQAKAKVLHQALHDVDLKFKGEKVRDLTQATIGNLYLGQQLVMFGRYSGSGEVGIELQAKISGQERTWSTTALLPEIDRDNPEIERLWALSKIEGAMEQIRETGETEPLRRQIVELGTEYSLVTDYTSMLVVQDVVLENEGIAKRNADRVQRERAAQQQRENAPVKNYQVDRSSGSGGMFKGLPSPGIGSGPVGPLFIGVLAWLNRRKRNLK
ncbi:marine proteobacterial sortase target protein [Desulfuromonas versatilis]|uniref:Marine proteobacterial sortase target protein n=1 Tax=Desulfuromonas versatilis TaxID=2802975 RepID=A0ABN6DUR6_9BACT|nr:VIT domain-containing protein [Desulfuromonas versatilis]BCR03614.1 marine proteobacterial sortase target protein [Desulfuromonas versatilis]